jgi:carboxyl-terminal processing protease
MFLTGGKRIVYTRGRLPDASEDYYTTGRGRFTDQPLIVMVDHGSASASEIVSGALQDWDRALILGQTTFGKGLVQRQYRLKNGAALLLTVARYYTPSGRLIQRDYSDRDAYLAAETLDEIEATHADAIVDSTREKFRTAGNRTVLGGGGIFPDVEIDLAYPGSETTTKLNADRAFFDFAPVYISRNGLDQKSLDFDGFRRDFRMSDQDLEGFESFLTERELEFSPDSLSVHRELVERSMKAEIARTLWGEPQRYQILIEADPELREAMSYLPEAKLMARRVVDGEPGPIVDQN